jgi:hypothetical protein
VSAILRTLVSEPSNVPEGPRPQDGDIVVTREAHSRVHYTVRQLPGIVQFSTSVREEAVQLARSFARQYHIDVWYWENGTYCLLEACRPRTLGTHTSCIHGR